MASSSIRVFFAIVFCLSFLSAQAQSSKLKSGDNQYEKGKLDGNRRVGIWEYFDEKGVPELTFNYDSSRIVSMRPDTTKYWLKVDSTWQMVRPMRAPHFLGSNELEIRKIVSKVRYPANALRNLIQGDVLVSYVVGTDGQAHDFTIEKGLSAECDQEVWRALKDHYITWIPAIYQGRLVPARFYLWCTFRIGTSSEIKDSEEVLISPDITKNAHFIQHIVTSVIAITTRTRTVIPQGF